MGIREMSDESQNHRDAEVGRTRGRGFYDDGYVDQLIEGHSTTWVGDESGRRPRIAVWAVERAIDIICACG